MVIVVLGTQMGIIFWLGDAKPLPPHPHLEVPSLQLTGPGAADLLALTDPTLLALPHQQGFSGPAWLTVEPQQLPRQEWRDNIRAWLLMPPVEQLGGSFRRFMATNTFATEQLPSQPLPRLVLPEASEVENFADHSTFRLTGGLASRRLLIPLELPSWTNSDLLTNSIVQLAVAADGRPISFTLLNNPPGCGDKNADQRAVEIARTLRFEPLGGSGSRTEHNPLAEISWGEFVLEWHTIALPLTNRFAK
jgi:hypothetical protein